MFPLGRIAGRYDEMCLDPEEVIKPEFVPRMAKRAKRRCYGN